MDLVDEVDFDACTEHVQAVNLEKLKAIQLEETAKISERLPYLRDMANTSRPRVNISRPRGLTSARVEAHEERMKRIMDRADMENVQKWRHYIFKMPWLKFKQEWEVSVIPPYHGALVRFIVRDSRTPQGKHVSVYFDGHGALGDMDDYWEVFPVNREPERCEMNDTEALMGYIQAGLDSIAAEADTDA